MYVPLKKMGIFSPAMINLSEGTQAVPRRKHPGEAETRKGTDAWTSQELADGGQTGHGAGCGVDRKVLESPRAA